MGSEFPGAVWRCQAEAPYGLDAIDPRTENSVSDLRRFVHPRVYLGMKHETNSAHQIRERVRTDYAAVATATTD